MLHPRLKACLKIGYKCKEETKCSCGGPDQDILRDTAERDYETIQLEKTKNICPMCEEYEKTLHLMNSEMAVKVEIQPFLNCSVSPNYFS